MATETSASTGVRRFVPPALRRGLVERVDPAIARRGSTIVRRRLRGRAPVGGATASAADGLRDAVLSGLARALREGTASDADRAQLVPLVKAYLEDAKHASIDTSLVPPLAEAFDSLWQPVRQPNPPPHPAVEKAILDSGNRLYYHLSARTWKDTYYRGVQVYKCPTDMWVYAELIDDLRPGLVIETGTYRGGSALFIADRLETLGHGHVVSIDIDTREKRPTHPRLTYFMGVSSTAPDTVERVRELLPTDGSPVLVILDSDHSEAHVADELLAYAPLVTVGSYLIVEDTNINGHPSAPTFGPGPWEAAQKFLATDPGFEVDKRCERYGLTQNPDGFLRRRRPELDVPVSE